MASLTVPPTEPFAAATSPISPRVQAPRKPIRLLTFNPSPHYRPSSLGHALTTLGFAPIYHSTHPSDTTPYFSAQAWTGPCAAGEDPLHPAELHVVFGSARNVEDKLVDAAFAEKLVVAYKEAQVVVNLTIRRGKDGKEEGSVERDRGLEQLRLLVPRERLLEWREEDGWGPLCEFLGKKVPSGKEAEAAEGKTRELEEVVSERVRAQGEEVA